MTRCSRTRLVSIASAVLLPLCLSAAHAQTWQFTNCGAEGRLGPSQADCNTEYSGSPLAGAVTVADGIQQWTVPATGQYLIQADGAAGGTQQYTGDDGVGVPSPGGLGASLQGTFNLTAGETLLIIVGQMGGDTQTDVNTGDDWESAAPGGGGGTFVYRDANDALPLMAAGGGGSGSNCTANTDLQNASLLTAGNSAEGLVFDSGLVNGGVGGNGGTSNFAEDSNSYWAGGGAGWLTNGTGGYNPTDYDPAGSPDEGADGGLAPRNGATGGLRHIDSNDEGGDGGFGGGGGGGSDNMGGGGGGGFSGGGGADGSDCLSEEDSGTANNPGGGGGSYNGGSAPSISLAASRSHGQVTIRAASLTPAAPAIPVPGLSLWGLIALMLSLGLVGMWGLRRN